MSDRVALITGITGQDGSYLAEFLLAKGYQVHGIVRRNSDFTSKRIDRLLGNSNVTTHYGDMVDVTSLHALLTRTRPTEIYNLAAQSHVQVSFNVPDYSAEVNAVGSLRLLSLVKELGLNSRYYQASTSELFGGLPGTEPQSENTPFMPRSPYAAGKLFAYWTVRNYREAYGMFAVNGVLFNHESPRRGRTFVTKKITQAVARIARGEQDRLVLGNLDAERDWGYAPEYVEAMWLMLQQDKPDDYVVGTGVSTSVRRFVELCFQEIGIAVEWRPHGVAEVGVDAQSGKILVETDPRYLRPLEVEILRADPSKIQREIGWRSKTDVAELARIMVRYDLAHDEYGFDDLVPDDLIARWRKRPA